MPELTHVQYAHLHTLLVAALGRQRRRRDLPRARVLAPVAAREVEQLVPCLRAAEQACDRAFRRDYP